MADTKISALGAATALAGTEAIPVVQSAATVKATPAQVLTYVCGNATPITITGGTVTASTPTVTETQTWNSGAITFVGKTSNITDTASASGSLLERWQVGGVTQISFSAKSYGDVNFGDRQVVVDSFKVGTAFYLTVNGPTVSSGIGYFWGSGNANGAKDTGLARHAAGVVKVTNGSSGAGVLLTPALTVATLPAAATAGAGARSFVTDANATTFLSTVAGGGANKVPVVSDGTNWLIG